MKNKNIWKENRGRIIMSCIVLLLPVLAGILLWDVLPAQMTTHWGADGVVDGWSSKIVVVFVLPLILLLLHLGAMFLTLYDPGNKRQTPKALGMVFWLCPVVSLVSCGMIYATVLDVEIKQERVVMLLLCLMFIVIGNYLPKMTRNTTLGIKLPWTLQDDENWNHTHRLGGKVFTFGGILMLPTMILPEKWANVIFPAILLVVVCIPMVYSYWFYRKQCREGTSAAQIYMEKSTPWGKVSAVFLIVVLSFVGVILFTGNVKTEYGEASFTIKASFWGDLEVDYQAVESLEYRENCETGSRTGGVGSPRLQVGHFRNDEFGPYMRYTYTFCEPCVVLTVGEEILVINDKNDEATRELYEELQQMITP